MKTSRKENTSRRTDRRRRTGAATVELAIASPLLLIFLLGTIDAGQYANAYQIVSNASREGARVAARAGTFNTATVQFAVMDYLSAAFPTVPRSELSAALKTNVTGVSGETLTDDELANIATGSPVQVDVSLEFDAVRYIPGLDQFDNRIVRTSTTMRRE